ncbi:hypothetical protein QMK19_19710 [Streptomyces sp. H10-C2]|uniref:hypothetical protein n=1 Tax=unclassified Streptomyces TaxID=2593676 RepID=UPI0024BAEFFD|nr:MULTISPECIES: hypothetical protein [unclassified Streptomyces]MDJ0343348.1 hypothetical protein [Streptomyces sp. PH10-H1]MDJ0371841.1 hypothetical protein [Streptomyces sp. H10-C2]
MRPLPLAVKVLATAAALPLALTACSSGTSGSPSGSTAPAPATTAPQDPNAGLRTGTQLTKALAPKSFFTAGFAVDPSGVRDSGGTYIAPATAGAAKPDCSKLGGTSWIAVTGVTGVSFSQNDYMSKNTSEDIAQEIDVYQGTTAADVVKSLKAIAAACHTYTDSQTHSKVKVTGKSTTGLGDTSYTITLTDSAWQNGSTLVAAQTGTSVVSVLSTDGHDNGAATAKKLLRRIVASLKSTA